MSTIAYDGGSMEVGSGTVSVTDLQVEPDAVIFIGTNSGTENSVVTGDNLGVFMGFMARQYDTGSLLSYSTSILPEQGARNASKPICMASSWNTQEYAASAVSLDTGGFTVNFDDSGTGQIYWLAIQSEDIVAVPRGYGEVLTVPLGFIGKSMLTLCYRGGPDMNNDVFAGLHHAGFGGGTYVEARGVQQAGGFIEMVSGNAGRHEVREFVNPAAQFVIGSGGYISLFLTEEFGSGKPTGTPPTNFTVTGPNENMSRYLIWEAEGSTGFGTFPAGVGNRNSISLALNPNLEAASALVGYTVADSPRNANAPSAVVGLSLACMRPDETLFAASVFADGVAAPKTLYQTGNGIVTDVDGSSVQVGEVEFQADYAEMDFVTTIDGVGGGPPIVWHAFEGVWVAPQFFRILNR